jgi:3-oxoacyl-[acyl-carrier protein] reductase
VARALDGKAFVVTGADAAPGSSVAARLLEEGAMVLLAGGDGEALERVAAELGQNARQLAADLARPAHVDRLVAYAPLALPQLDGVVVSAADNPPGAALDLGEEEWEEAVWSWIVGPVLLLRGLAPLLVANGCILFVTPSSEGAAAEVLQPAVEALARVLARELAPAARVHLLSAVEAHGATLLETVT